MTASPPAVTCLIVPGLNNSGPDHWQTRWEVERGDCRRVDLGCWSSPERDQWLARLHDVVRATPGRLALAAHSLGCLATVWWAKQAPGEELGRIVAALLVAPPDVDRDDAAEVLRRFAPAPETPLPFPAILAASRDDPYCSFRRQQELADRWGCRLADMGALGHINARSRVGSWPEGQALLETLITPP